MNFARSETNIQVFESEQNLLGDEILLDRNIWLMEVFQESCYINKWSACN